MPDDPELVSAPDAPLGSGDATRRWALRFPDGMVRFPGLTRPEAEGASALLAGTGTDEVARTALPVELPALLSDGAGPHLLCADGALALALGPHPSIQGCRVAMSEAHPHHRIGLVVSEGDGRRWRWAAQAMVDPEVRIEALDDLAAAADDREAAAWALRFAGMSR